jgi:glycosyltransferase involved in cell wall biosynthesis
MATSATQNRVRLSVVIPCLDEGGRIQAQLERFAAEAWSEPWEIVVADNGSNDGTREIVERSRARIPHLRLVDASARLGSCHARNVGAAAARGDLIAFCDADDEIQPGWLAAMGDALLTHQVVAGRLDSVRLNDPWLIRVLGMWQDEGLTPFGAYLHYASSANFGVHRSLHDRIGGFDEEFLGAAHDIDYSWRLQQAGAAIHFEPRAVTSYRFRRDLRSLYRQGRFYALGFVSVYKKHRHHLPRQRHPWLLGALSWIGLLRRLPIPPSRRTFGSFAWHLGWKVGMVEGSIRNRVILLSIREIV